MSISGRVDGTQQGENGAFSCGNSEGFDGESDGRGSNGGDGGDGGEVGEVNEDSNGNKGGRVGVVGGKGEDGRGLQEREEKNPICSALPHDFSSSNSQCRVVAFLIHFAAVEDHVGGEAAGGKSRRGSGSRDGDVGKDICEGGGGDVCGVAAGPQRQRRRGPVDAAAVVVAANMATSW